MIDQLLKHLFSVVQATAPATKPAGADTSSTCPTCGQGVTKSEEDDQVNFLRNLGRIT
jgi:hypothetical protein